MHVKSARLKRKTHLEVMRFSVRGGGETLALLQVLHYVYRFTRGSQSASAVERAHALLRRLCLLKVHKTVPLGFTWRNEITIQEQRRAVATYPLHRAPPPPR